MKRLLSVFAGLLIGAMATFASQLPFGGTYDVYSVSGATNTGWRLIGTFADDSLLGYGAADCVTGDVVLCYSSAGDDDLYIVTNVVSVSGPTLTVDVIYDEAGTPRVGAPEAGRLIMGRQGADKVPYTPSLTFGAYPEYLLNGARYLFLKYAIDNINTNGGTGTNTYDGAAIHTNQIGSG